MVGLDLADAGEQLPGEAEAECGPLVEDEVVSGDVGERGRARQRLVAAEPGRDHRDGDDDEEAGHPDKHLHPSPASSAGSLVARRCSASLALIRSGKRSSPTTKSPLPRGQVSR